MLRAYDAGLLHIIPFSPSSLVEIDPPQPLPLEFVDRNVCHSRGGLVCHGVFKNEHERKLEFWEFLHMFGERRLRPEKSLKYTMPLFVIQSHFTDFARASLRYLTLESSDADSAHAFTDILSNMEKSEAEDYAGAFIEHFSNLQKRLGSPAGTCAIEGNQIWYSRVMSPDGTGSWLLEYNLRWERQRFSFYLNETIRSFVLSEQALKNIVFGGFLDNLVYWKDMSLVRLSNMLVTRFQ